MAYDSKLKEEEIKNRVAADVFGDYDCARILGAVDFCVMSRKAEVESQKSKVKSPDGAFSADRPSTIQPFNPSTEDESLLWAEAKAGIRDDFAPLFAQLILTLGKARTFDEHLPPPFLGAFDCEKIAFVPYHEVVDIFYQNDFNWNVAPSDPSTREFGLILDRIRPLLASNLRVFRFDEDAIELDTFVRKALCRSADGPSASLNVTRNNFVFVYQKWARDVKPSIAVNWDGAKKQGILDADFFLADLLSKDGATLVEKLYVVLRGNHYELDRKLDAAGFIDAKRAEFNDGQKAHQLFWNRYRRPPNKKYWSYIAERRDLLVPQDVRERKGSFFTPQIWVEKAQEAIAAVLGDNWQDEYDVWDCAAGTGNLLAGLQNKYRIWASTLDRADVEVMRERIKNGANLLESHVFQFDFLNGTFEDLPEGLKTIVQDPERRKKLVVFINPPYAEAGSSKTSSGTGSNKAGVTKETVAHRDLSPVIGPAANELFALFLMRAARMIEGCVLAQFSKLKHIQAPNFGMFREMFLSRLEKGFLVPAKTFDNVKGEFPIGFFVWRTGVPHQSEMDINADVYDANGNHIGMKRLFQTPFKRLWMDWLKTMHDKKGEIIGFFRTTASDFQNQNGSFITNAPSANDFKQIRIHEITKSNFFGICNAFAVRLCIEPTWLNDRDQFLWPADTWRTDCEFQMDCLVFTLFHGQNRISCKAGVNHWIPFPESEVDAKDAYKSHFMVDFLRRITNGKLRIENGELNAPADNSQFSTFNSQFSYPDLFASQDNSTPSTFQRAANGGVSTLSTAASRVLDAGRRLWRYYHAQPTALPDASFYDIRAHFQGFKPNGHMNADSPDAEYTRLIGDLRAAMKALAAQIAPKVREHGFLR